MSGKIEGSESESNQGTIDIDPKDVKNPDEENEEEESQEEEQDSDDSDPGEEEDDSEDEEEGVDSFFIDMSMDVTDSDDPEQSRYIAELQYFVGCNFTEEQFTEYEENDSLVNSLLPMIHVDLNSFLRRAGYPLMPYHFMIIRNDE